MSSLQDQRDRPNSAARSTDPEDYQRLTVAVAAMRKLFVNGSSTSPHHHRRHQLLYAVSGTMRIRTRDHNWIVPPERALFMPAGLEHDVTARGDVDMCTLYVATGTSLLDTSAPSVITVSALLRELIVALLAEPADYDPAGRGGRLAALILDEIMRGRRVALSIPMPGDKRLRRICEDFLENPSDDRSIDSLAEAAGASSRTLSRLFRSELAMSFSAWRQQVRFQYALEAAARGEPISRIARNCGYRSTSAFAAAFRKAFGVPPSQMSAKAVTRQRSD